jgi:uncharacterized membrane protein
MTLTPERRASPADYESTPLTRQEYISAIVHLYRGELDRATTWRLRLDNTTNWAVITTAGLLSFAFGVESHSHVVLLIGVAMISVFWLFEARRYRYADMWYARVRKIEENFYGPILRRDPVSPVREWGQLVAEDLFRPRFKVSRAYALRKRLLRNYWAIYLVLLGAWAVKLMVHPTAARSWDEVRQRMVVGVFPWWAPLSGIAVFLVLVAGILLATRDQPDEDEDHWRLSP